MASGYDLSSKVPYRLMKGRLGVYDKPPFDPSTTTVEGVVDQATRFRQLGGNRQQERMIKDKRRSLDHAVWNSYQAAEVLRLDAENRKPVRALINPNKLKQDYDDKVLSIGYEYNFHPGDIFEWIGTGTYWLIYLQDLTELAYFRGDIRRCSYQIAWYDKDADEIHTTYAAVRGPVETKINFIQKGGISEDSPNHSLNILIPRNEHTMKYFKRYAEFYIQGDDLVCWRVEAIDWISTPGILEIAAVEYYKNNYDDAIEAGIANIFSNQVIDPNEMVLKVDDEFSILGETFIKVKKSYDYEFDGAVSAQWSVDKDVPVVLTQNPEDPRKVSLRWTDVLSGQFELRYGDYSKVIVVESLF